MESLLAYNGEPMAHLVVSFHRGEPRRFKECDSVTHANEELHATFGAHTREPDSWTWSCAHVVIWEDVYGREHMATVSRMYATNPNALAKEATP